MNSIAVKYIRLLERFCLARGKSPLEKVFVVLAPCLRLGYKCILPKIFFDWAFASRVTQALVIC